MMPKNVLLLLNWKQIELFLIDAAALWQSWPKKSRRRRRTCNNLPVDWRWTILSLSFLVSWLLVSWQGSFCYFWRVFLITLLLLFRDWFFFFPPGAEKSQLLAKKFKKELLWGRTIGLGWRAAPQGFGARRPCGNRWLRSEMRWRLQVLLQMWRIFALSSSYFPSNTAAPVIPLSFFLSWWIPTWPKRSSCCRRHIYSIHSFISSGQQTVRRLP